MAERTSRSRGLVNPASDVTDVSAFPDPDRTVRPALTPAESVALVDLLALSGHFLGRVADHELAARLAEQSVCEAPEDGVALLARARSRAALHRFAEAMADLDAAERAGAARGAVDRERATVLGAVGCHAEAHARLRDASAHGSGFTRSAAAAVVLAELGEAAEAEQAFEEARRLHREVSPFPLARLDFRRGVMWRRRGDLATAREWFEAAVRRVPGYAPAIGRLAEVALLRGDPEAAVDLLRPVVETSDDPEYAARLVLALRAVGHHREARTWQDRAAERYDELVRNHPEAYTGPAAHFWLTTGADLDRGIRLTLHAGALRRATRARVLHRLAGAADRRPPGDDESPRTWAP
ncbi:tetratricopeptide repeat protein [Streptomyces sp. NPDC002643]